MVYDILVGCFEVDELTAFRGIIAETEIRTKRCKVSGSCDWVSPIPLASSVFSSHREASSSPAFAFTEFMHPGFPSSCLLSVVSYGTLRNVLDGMIRCSFSRTSPSSQATMSWSENCTVVTMHKQR